MTQPIDQSLQLASMIHALGMHDVMRGCEKKGEEGGDDSVRVGDHHYSFSLKADVSSSSLTVPLVQPPRHCELHGSHTLESGFWYSPLRNE